YKEHPPLWQVEDSWSGFQWLQPNDIDNSVVIFTRWDKEGNGIICVTNFTPQFLPQYRFGLPADGVITEALN
ncbi:alpha amylase C-terminal domain-containing protein, partial [Salmonella enterica]|uniref:alpha amylase C-terminal domain-containing protein n=1 Tax=Salmonella enterica TaxID=28901 RepID=UPI003CF93BB4